MKFLCHFQFYDSQKLCAFLSDHRIARCPTYIGLSGRVLLVCAQLSWRPSLNSVLLRHLRHLLFREADIQSRLSSSWLVLQGSWRNKSPTWNGSWQKPAAVDWLWPPLLRCTDKAMELTDRILFLKRKVWNFLFTFLSMLLEIIK